MSALDLLSCRICLSPSSSFISVFSRFHDRPVRQILEKLTQIKIRRNSKVPKFICEQCFVSLLSAESIIDVCRKNDAFLNELASVEEEVDDNNEQEVLVEVVDDDENSQQEVFEQPATSYASIPWDSFERLNEESKLKQKSAKTKNFFCSFCGKSCETRQKLSYHEKSRHSKAVAGQLMKPFTCDRCGTSFKQKSHMINHLNVVHLKIKRFQCAVCSFSMYSKSHYTSHAKTHLNIKEFECEKCDKKFARKETLTTHLKTHENLRPYVCKFCGKAYTAHTDWKIHIFKHTNVHPYICEICKTGFFKKRELFEHVKELHHGIDTSSWLNGKTSWVNLMN